MIPAETLVIAGPTGTGKTDLSLRLAERLGGEIVGADAFQIYAGLPILTAQPTPGQLARVPHHLVGSVDPRESYDAARYRREALDVLRSIAARGKRPIVVGGTGLYVKALLGGLDELPDQDPVLREEFLQSDLSTLVARLRERDPEGAASIDCANRRRVERALEIVTLTGKPLSEVRKGPRPMPPGVRGILIMRERGELNRRIASNVEEMFARGVEAEVAALPEEQTGTTASMTLGLREIRDLLRGGTSRAEAQESIIGATRRYAKRQMTWFRNQHDFAELDAGSFSDNEAAAVEIQRLLEV
ncbi:MAG: tRNA (adenosine(37)-N6)-dimethylallyltransferase MiaA [Chthoniobacterales bacterium]